MTFAHLHHRLRVIVWGAAAVCAVMSTGGLAADVPPPALGDKTAIKLLKALDERRMPDVALWVLDRVAADAAAGKEVKQEVAFRRASALVGVTKSESDPEKRAGLLDEAQKAMDAFLQSDPPLDRRIEALIQKGTLLVARGRMTLDKSKQPGADVEKLRAAAVPFFEQAIAVLKGSSPAKDQPITDVNNAENAVLKALREVDAALKAASTRADAADAGDQSRGDGDKEAKSPKKRPAPPKTDMRSIMRMEEDRETLRGQLLQVRLLIADAYFDSSRALEPKSPAWKAALDESTKRYAELFKKYPTRGAGLLARCNEGRNYAALGDYTKALTTLADTLAMEGSGDLVDTLRAKALGTSLECWLAAEQYDALTDSQLKIAMASVPDDKIDSDVLAMKYGAALMLDRRAAAIPDSEKVKRGPLQRNARKLATDVAKAGRDHAIEARDLLSRLGGDFDVVAASDASFSSMMDQARLSITTMQEKQVLAKEAAAAGKDDEKQKAEQAAREARGQATAVVSKALALSGGEQLEDVNQARMLLTFLLYEGNRLHEAATLGGFLADRYPSSRGSSQAAMIAMASWQQLQRQADPAWSADARAKCGAAAEAILRGWPDSKEAADAAVVAIASAVDAHAPERIMAVLGMIPAQMPRREEVLLRAGMGLSREVQEARRRDGADPSAADAVAAMRKRAVSALDEGLALVAKGGPADALSVTAALSRCQVAIEDGDDATVAKLLEHPSYGPWTAVTGTLPKGISDAAVGNVLTLALRYFIASQQIPKAEQAMNLLEERAGSGEAAAAKLTSMYLSMGRDLQEQLQALAGSKDPSAAERTAVVLAGFETFLDRVAKRDDKIASQMWVASMYDALASGEGSGASASKAKAKEYLAKAAEVYERLLGERAAELGGYEPTLRLKIAGIYRDRREWDKARGHVDWFLSDPRRQNMIDAQFRAAELSQAQAEASDDPVEAAKLFHEAINGGKRGDSAPWGWGGIANKLVRPAFSGTGERAERAQEQFFDARLRVSECYRAWAEKDASKRDALLEKAATSIAITAKLAPALGGELMRKRFDDLLREIQKARGQNPDGLSAIEAAAAKPDGAGT
ncbi:MAG: hypothetical protein ACKOEX_06930 [Planctomycetia bacterium]